MDDLKLLIEGRSAVETGRGPQLRELAGLTQAEVAELVGVTPAAISRWEAGSRVPSGPSAITYAKTLRRIEQLLTKVTK
jgi:transcriptional regulator with XRE-family HTH domain